MASKTEENQEVEERVKSAAFEGLLVRAMTPSENMLRDLAAIGVDPARLELDYPIATWHRCVHLVRQELFPSDSVEEGTIKVGKLMVDGYEQTVIGSIVARAAPLMGPAMFLKRVERAMNSPRSGKGIKVDVEVVGPTERILHCLDRYALPYFNVGLLHGILQRCLVNPKVTLEKKTSEGFDLRIRWTPRGQ